MGVPIIVLPDALSSTPAKGFTAFSRFIAQFLRSPGEFAR
jgi:hypothetical protein